MRSLGGCYFGHSKEDVERTKRFRACAHGLLCSYITDNVDDCEFNHGNYQRSSAPVPAEPGLAKVEEVCVVVAPSVGTKKTNKKNNNVNRSAPAPAPAATPVAAVSSSASASAQSIAEIQKDFAKIDSQVEFLLTQMKFMQMQVDNLLTLRQELVGKIHNLAN